MRKKVLILGLCLLGVTHSLSSKDKKSIPLYKDAKAPIEKRIDDLISRMTLEEKVGQMDMVTVWDKCWRRSEKSTVRDWFFDLL